jgi:hypothetical protein
MTQRASSSVKSCATIENCTGEMISSLADFMEDLRLGFALAVRLAAGGVGVAVAEALAIFSPNIAITAGSTCSRVRG